MPHPPLFVHIGLQKTGTSYLQSIFWANQEQLAAQGLDLVPSTKRAAFHTMLRVRERYQPDLDPPAVRGALQRFERDLANAPGTRALLSQESLSSCTPSQVETLLGACGDREVHVVLTVRDLGRQLPSAWQENLRAGGSVPYEKYLRRLRRQSREADFGDKRPQFDPPNVLARWAAHVPAERIHVVTVPPPGSSPTLLLERYCRVLGVDPTALSTDVVGSNTGLGRLQSEVLRRVNAGLEPELRRRQVYGDVGKRYFAVRVLARQERRAIRVPTRFESWVRQLSESQISALEEAGYTVEGDLADLRSHASAFSEEERPPKERAVAAAAVRALVDMLTLRARKDEAPEPDDEGDSSTPLARARRAAARVRERVVPGGISH
ncbi:hypothetical protein ACT8ZV_06505 [Nocardioides sp. MAHUQ-72]|uniref:hypothetical protein n=1 Tax=unclassified Nocardioides TaxID=2615069 RepID=UPI003621620B